MAQKNSTHKKTHQFQLHPFGVALLLFAVLFGAIGSYIVLFSKAATPLTWTPPSGYSSYPVFNVTVSTANNTNLDGKGGDMYIKLPSQATGPITIKNCRNAVVIGGQITIPANTGAASPDVRGVYINNCSGTVHIEGVYIDGGPVSAEGDGVAINSPNAIVQIENVRVNKLNGGYDTAAHNHSDIIQPWGGVKELRVDYLTGSSNYQGFQINDDQGHIGKVTIKNTNIGDSGVTTPDGKGGYYLWLKCGTGTQYVFSNFYLNPRSGRSLSSSIWDGGCGTSVGSNVASFSNTSVNGTVKGGSPTADFVPAGTVGLGYKATGYAVSSTSPSTPTTPTTPTTPSTPSVPTTPSTPSNPTVPTTPATPPSADVSTTPVTQTSTISGTVTLAAPSTTDTITKTEVYVDGKLVKSTPGNSAPSLNTAQISNGEHTITVKTTAVNGAVTEASQNIDVNNSFFTQVLGQMTSKTGKATIGIFVVGLFVAVLVIYKKIPTPFTRRQ